MARLSTVLIVLGLSVPVAASGSQPDGNPHDMTLMVLPL